MGKPFRCKIGIHGDKGLSPGEYVCKKCGKSYTVHDSSLGP